MNLYDNETKYIEHKIEEAAADHDGEIPDELLQQLIEAETKEIQQVERLCKYLQHLELFIDTCDQETRRIQDHKARAVKRMESVKRYMLPYVQKRGKHDAGAFKLSTRKSSSVDVRSDFDNKKFMVKIPESWRPDKKRIKEILKGGIEIEGACLVDKINLVIR